MFLVYIGTIKASSDIDMTSFCDTHLGGMSFMDKQRFFSFLSVNHLFRTPFARSIEFLLLCLMIMLRDKSLLIFLHMKTKRLYYHQDLKRKAKWLTSSTEKTLFIMSLLFDFVFWFVCLFFARSFIHFKENCKLFYSFICRYSSGT